MDCSLWFGRCRINSASEIAEHFDLASLRGYFLGGKLVEWLREHGGEQQAERIESLDPSDPELDSRLAQAFGVEAPSVKQVFTGTENVRDVPAVGSYNGSFAVGSGFGYQFGSYSGSFAGSYAGSYSGSYLGSYVGSYSGSYTKFSLWEWEWEWRFGGSFRSSYGSFGGSFWSGSFTAGSFMYGSFAGGSFPFGGSFPGFGAYPFGSFPAGYGSFMISADDYDRIMYECLRRCPLDCFGYGIHII